MEFENFWVSDNITPDSSNKAADTEHDDDAWDEDSDADNIAGTKVPPR